MQNSYPQQAFVLRSIDELRSYPSGQRYLFISYRELLIY